MINSLMEIDYSIQLQSFCYNIFSMLNRNLAIYILITALSIGALIVYAMNNMEEPKEDSSKALGNTTQPAQDTNQADDQTIQNFDLNNQAIPTQKQEQPKTNAQVADPTSTPIPITSVNELKIQDVTEGQGEAVKSGDKVEVNYLGTFLSGEKFDSSYDRNQTFSFTVGAGAVIKGWDQGLVGMKAGGKRILLIPSDLAYGQRGSPGAIPPNTPLKFEIELVSINP